MMENLFSNHELCYSSVGLLGISLPDPIFRLIFEGFEGVSVLVSECPLIFIHFSYLSRLRHKSVFTPFFVYFAPPLSLSVVMIRRGESQFNPLLIESRSFGQKACCGKRGLIKVPIISGTSNAGVAFRLYVMLWFPYSIKIEI